MKYFFSLLVLAFLLLGCSENSSDSGITENENLDIIGDDAIDNEALFVGSIEFTLLPDSITKEPFAYFTFAAENASEYECKLDQQAYNSCSSPYTIFPISVGIHELAVRVLSDSEQTLEPSVVNWTVSSIFGDEHDASIDPDLNPTTVMPSTVEDNSWRGIVRINCDFSHSSYDDPIVYPGQDGAAHLHRFYGNTLLDENSTIDSLFTSGESTCQGNELNRSAYWVPALLAPSYHPDTGQRRLDDNGEPAWQAVPAVVGNDDEAHEIFYYSAGIDDLEAIQPIPLGLKMIAGNHMGQPEMEQDTTIVRWHCQSWESSDASNPRWSTSIPECIAPDRLRMDIFFPSCWNGVDLDSSDHKSHLSYPVNNAGPNGTVCPDTHPVPIIRVSFHYAFGVKPEVYEPGSLSSRGWRLASDMYEANTATPGGMSLHGDWFNAWHPEALQVLLDSCIKEELDCHDGNLANGFRLTGTREGSQTEPAVINEGLGE